MKIGILQGRLSPPINGQIQEFPVYSWEKEFDYVKKLNVNGIEWIITENFFLNNPFFSSVNFSDKILSVCADNLVNDKIYDSFFLKSSVEPIIKKMLKLKLKTLVVPLLDKSSIQEKSVAENFLKNFTKIADNFPEIDFCFEFEASKDLIFDIVNARKNFFLTYDTGNFTSFFGKNVDHSSLIYFFNSKIKNVHLKDRTFDGVTKKFNTGDTNFIEIFKVLKEINYNNNYILQFARDEEGEEFNYLKSTIKQIKKVYSQK